MSKPGEYEGRTFGRYHLAKMVAKGGMGSVYLARLEGLMDFEKIVAVKVIHPSIAKDPHVLAMFQGKFANPLVFNPCLIIYLDDFPTIPFEIRKMHVVKTIVGISGDLFRLLFQSGA